MAKGVMAAAMTLIVAAAAAAEAPLLRKCTVEAEMIVAPDVQYRTHSAFSPRNPSSSKWLMLKIEYTPDVAKTYVPEYRLRKGGPGVFFPGWIDDVKLETRAVFETGIVYRGRSVNGLFTGETVLAAVKRDGRRHLALMFVPARLLDRYCVPGFGVRTVHKNAFRVEVTLSAAGKVLGRAYCNVPGNTVNDKTAEFEKLVKAVPASLNLPNTILSRSRSPWALLAPDNFDWEKEASGENRR